MKKFIYHLLSNQKQQGQSLIETIMAIFVLTTALTAGLGLSIYAFSSAAVSQNEIVASNLAREGVEVVRAMRDTNWLESDAKGPGNENGKPPWQLSPCDDIGGRLCYARVYDGIPGGNFHNYDFNSGNQVAIFDPTDFSWSLDSTGQLNVNLFLQANGTYTNSSNGTSIYGRMINLTFNSNAPYTNQNSNQEMIVKSVVAWRDKNCATFDANQDLLVLATPCKVVVEEHMTNWKDYK